MSMLAIEVAQKLEEWGVGQFAVADPADRTIFIGQFPEDNVEGVMILSAGSGLPPHEYIDTEYPVLDFWSRSPNFTRSYDLLNEIFEALHRRADWTTDSYNVYFSQALGNIIDAGRDVEDGKLYRLTVQFICRNLSHIS